MFFFHTSPFYCLRFLLKIKFFLFFQQDFCRGQCFFGDQHVQSIKERKIKENLIENLKRKDEKDYEAKAISRHSKLCVRGVFSIAQELQLCKLHTQQMRAKTIN